MLRGVVVMDEKQLRFLENIGINEDYIEYFNGSEVLKVLIDKESNSFHFVMKIANILDIEVYDDLLLSLRDAFNYDIKLTLEFDGDDYSKVGGYVNRIIEGYSSESIRFGVFKNRSVEVDGKVVNFLVYNKIEEMNISNKVRDIVKTLKEYGFNNIEFNVKLENKEDTELLDRIESERNVSNDFKYSEKKSSEVSTNSSGEKTYYRPRKSNEVTKIKDLLYEVDNINIEVEIFGIDLFEAKSGYKIFTLKVTDYTDSMYVKLFTKDEEEFKRIKDLLKNGNWYSMYGRLKEDSFSNNELVFMTRFRDIQAIDAKLDWVRTDKSDKKRVENYAHTHDGIQIDEFESAGTKLKVAVVSGLGNTRKLMDAIKRGDVVYDFVEVMSCPGG